MQDSTEHSQRISGGTFGQRKPSFYGSLVMHRIYDSFDPKSIYSPHTESQSKHFIIKMPSDSCKRGLILTRSNM